MRQFTGIMDAMKMKNYIPVLTLAFALGMGPFAVSSLAADKKGIEGLPLPEALESAPAAAVPAPAPKPAKVKVTKRQCAQIVTHTGADVAYKPGVDARGRKVAPVEMKSSGPKIEPPKEISFDINYDLSSKVTGTGGNVYDPNFKVGTVTVKGGVPYFNGQPLEDQHQKDLIEACKKIVR